MKKQVFVKGKHKYIDLGPGRARRFHRDGAMANSDSTQKPSEQVPIRVQK